jgi:hypothetical protein
MNRSMAALEELRLSMDRLLTLESSMDNLAGLEEPMRQLALLKESMDATSRLREPMEKLDESLTALLGMTESPWGYLIGGALLWGIVTFVAVWMGVMLGTRRLRVRSLAGAVDSN